MKICLTALSTTSAGIQRLPLGQVVRRARTSCVKGKVNEIANGDDDGSQRRVSRAASVYPMVTITAGLTSVTADVSSLGSSISQTQHMVDVADADLDLPAVAYQMVTRRGASAGSKASPSGQVAQVRVQAQNGADPTGRSRSPGEHEGAGRVERRVHSATRIENRSRP